eukprot:543271-Alexandrium_andersonii.AAC.1
MRTSGSGRSDGTEGPVEGVICRTRQCCWPLGSARPSNQLEASIAELADQRMPAEGTVRWPSTRRCPTTVTGSERWGG